MSEPEYVSFDEEEYRSALEAARQEFEGVDLRSVDFSTAQDASAEIRATCVELRSIGRRVCLILPRPLRRDPLCIPLNLPDGSIVRACLYVCTFWGIPIGACVRVYLAGELVAKRCIGACS